MNTGYYGDGGPGAVALRERFCLSELGPPSDAGVSGVERCGSDRSAGARALIWGARRAAGGLMIDGSFRGEPFRPLGLWWKRILEPHAACGSWWTMGRPGAAHL